MSAEEWFNLSVKFIFDNPFFVTNRYAAVTSRLLWVRDG
jgi:hypothetical protein